ncbi:MAG: selenide, water dikinase SelD [Candidatus Latescibacteria bacterium]|nr:selenide, water dikinase SelD [Candidatus Latescibacterota bacterium]NIM22287.1 selenide, water dikinase SelD [Candidatus Latescibacterota bacterium]NIM65766.1 selenide, water dikinase SelD [Candidatus Latescibacterota bacterium]NIO02151.1 selenide, water dikinase SelD [Candidatus Latescibacterota bacterium]NIO28983.1 selenide, water dikinase SelD [Candidatus Latescibacterota bacterium]
MHPNLIVGHNTADDAGVYRIGSDSALVLTVDFFQPVVDDPFDFGRVAVANSLSDVYAMGGEPFAALNIAGFPEGELPSEILSEIFKGGLRAAEDAGVVIVGGHTVKDKELKYGLAVVGRVTPDAVVTNAGAKAEDVLILTKPLGSGVLSTALRADKLGADSEGALVEIMAQLNREASRRMLEYGVHACTDITGYGLLGHALELALASEVTCEISSQDVPLLDGALELAGQGLLTAGGGTNRAFVEGNISANSELDEPLQHLLYDPQTSGGLLIALPGDAGSDLVNSLRPVYPHASIIGRVKKRGTNALIVK